MMKLEFPTLTADDIEVRVAQVRQNGLSLLLYKNARCDMRLLDSQGLTWQREHQVINGNLFCTVSIYDEDLQAWVSRQDVGTPSFAVQTRWFQVGHWQRVVHGSIHLGIG